MNLQLWLLVVEYNLWVFCVQHVIDGVGREIIEKYIFNNKKYKMRGEKNYLFMFEDVLE